MAADDRGADLLGVEMSGTGLHYQATAAEDIGGPPRQLPAGLRELLWEPAHLYPDEVWPAVCRRRCRPVRGLAGDQLAPRLPDLAAACVFRCDTASASSNGCGSRGGGRRDPRTVHRRAAGRRNEQAGGGHNLSLGHIAPTYHRNVLEFAEDCIVRRNDLTMEAR